MPVQPYKIRVRRGETEYEIMGDKEFVIAKAKEFESAVFGEPRAPSKDRITQASSAPAIGTPKTLGEKITKLRDDGFFKEPKGSPEVTAELRTRGWGIYKSKDVSRALLNYAPRLELRRIASGKNRFAYTYP